MTTMPTNPYALTYFPSLLSVLANFLDYTNHLMSRNDRIFKTWIVTLLRKYIAMTYTTGLDSNKHFVIFWQGNFFARPGRWLILRPNHHQKEQQIC